MENCLYYKQDKLLTHPNFLHRCCIVLYEVQSKRSDTVLTKSKNRTRFEIGCHPLRSKHFVQLYTTPNVFVTLGTEPEVPFGVKQQLRFPLDPLYCIKTATLQGLHFGEEEEAVESQIQGG